MAVYNIKRAFPKQIFVTLCAISLANIDTHCIFGIGTYSFVMLTGDKGFNDNDETKVSRWQSAKNSLSFGIRSP